MALLDIVPDRDVLCSLFADDEGHEQRQRLDAAIDGLNSRFGRGTVSFASSVAVVKSLDHGRIPFGPPTRMG